MGIGIKEIAAEAGVSVATVSLALNGKGKINEETRQRVLSIAKRLNYIPNLNARSLVKQKSGMIGLIVPDITNIFYANLVYHTNIEVRKYGYGLLIAMSNNSVEWEKKSIREMLQSRVEGLIVAPLNIPVDDFSYLENAPIPKIYAAAHYLNSEIPSVECRLREGYEKITNAIADSGRKKPVFLTGNENVLTLREREEGFLDSCRERGIRGELCRCRTFSYEGACSAASVMLAAAGDGFPFDAVVCANDMLAAGVVNTLTRSGIRVPEEVCVIGCDDVVFADTAVIRLTTLRQNIRRIAECAAEKLLLHIQDGTPITPERIDTELVMRDSF